MRVSRLIGRGTPLVKPTVDAPSERLRRRGGTMRMPPITHRYSTVGVARGTPQVVARSAHLFDRPIGAINSKSRWSPMTNAPVRRL